MADIEEQLLRLSSDEGRTFKAPPFLPRATNADLGLERLEGSRYYCPEFMAAEWQKIWTKTWQLVVRADEFEEPGDFYVYELGKESFLFVKGDDGEVRGFYNVCQHRGNRLCQADSGSLGAFTCPYHGWQWNIDGTLKKVADPQFFRQFDDGVPTDELGLTPVKIDFWGGWLWFNMDLEACSLEEYLGEAGRHLESYEFEKWTLINYQTFEWNGNWKHAWDAFHESYHFASLHPSMVEIGEGHDIPIELLGIHSRMLNFNRTVSEVLSDRDTMTPLRQHMMLTDQDNWGTSEATDFAGSARDLHLEEIRRRRESEDSSYLPFRNMNDEQLVHQYHYSFFPSATFTQVPEGGVIFRYRPHESDPNKCYYDFLIMAHLPPDTVKPEPPPHQIHRHVEGINYVEAFGSTFDPILSKVVEEDGSNMPTMQAGVKSDAFRGMILCDQELRIRHFHKVLDDFISGAVDTHNLPADNAYLTKN